MTNIIFIEDRTLYLFNKIAISFGGDCMVNDTSFYGIAVYFSVTRAIFFGLFVDNVWNSKLLQEDFED
jgi:hypothetical protein